MKNAILISAIAAITAMGLTHQAHAARSLTKSYKVSVTIPQIVGINTNKPFSEEKFTAENDPQNNVKETVVVRNNEKVLLRTFVVQ